MNRSTINLHHGDSLEAMKLMPDNAYDLAIVDPPYKDDVSGLNAGINRAFKYETFQAPTKEYFNQLFRVSKNQIVWGFNYFLELLPNTDACIFWYKHQNGHFSEGELAWCSIGKTRMFDRAYQKDIGNKFHPTQKPVKLYEWLLTNYAKEGDKILDTHGGSMSIALACHNLKFDLDLWELDEDYHAAGVKRFEQHKKQLKLF
jgi:site-specific DNA-methyltransferase (adenine-specific)